MDIHNVSLGLVSLGCSFCLRVYLLTLKASGCICVFMHVCICVIVYLCTTVFVGDKASGCSGVFVCMRIYVFVYERICVFAYLCICVCVEGGEWYVGCGNM